jgi:hypothetical protein
MLRASKKSASFVTAIRVRSPLLLLSGRASPANLQFKRYPGNSGFFVSRTWTFLVIFSNAISLRSISTAAVLHMLMTAASRSE